jgi:hypothetical protein
MAKLSMSGMDGARSHVAPMEPLEQRCLLSAFVYHPLEDVLGGPDPFIAAGVNLETLRVTGANEDADLWGASADQPFVVLDGVYHELGALPNLFASDRVLEVNTAGTVLGEDAAEHAFVWSGGVRTPIPAVFSGEHFQGPSPTVRAVDLANTGKVLLARTISGVVQTWVLDLASFRPSFLFNATPVALNDRGDALGRSDDLEGLGPGAIFRDAASGHDVRLLYFQPTALSSSGRIAGTYQLDRTITHYTEVTQEYTSTQYYWSRICIRIGGFYGYFAWLSRRTESYSATILVPIVEHQQALNHLIVDASSLAASQPGGVFGAEIGSIPGREITFDPVLLNDDDEALGYGFYPGTGQYAAQLADASSSQPIDREFHFRAPEGLFDQDRSAFLNISDEGRIIGWDSTTHRVFVLLRCDVVPLLEPHDGVAISAVTGTGLVAAAPSYNGNIVVFTPRASISGPTWAAGELGGIQVSFGPSTGTTSVFTDPATGLETIAVAAGYPDFGGGLLLYSRSAPHHSSGYYPASYTVGDEQWYIRNLTAELTNAHPEAPAHPLGGDITTIVGADGRVYIFGTTPGVYSGGHVIQGGHLVVYMRAAPATPDQDDVWTFQDISETDIIPRGQQTPFFWTRLVGYATPWGGLNVAGTDFDGSVHVVWTAPGMDHWEATNLSAITGAPPIVGDLAAYVAPWEGLNLAGTDADGNLHVLWWAPALGPGNWRHTDLTQEAGNGPRLRPHNIAGFVTPWNALNVAGTDAEGRVWVYWWTPITDRWVATCISLEIADPLRVPELNQGVGAAVTPSGVVSLFTTSHADGQVYRYFWQPGASWEVENLTESAVHT